MPGHTRLRSSSFVTSDPSASRKGRRNHPEHKPNLYAGLTARRLFRCEVQLVGHPGQLRQGSRLHLSHDLAAMHFYSDLADADVEGDLLVEAASHHQGHHLALPGGKSLEARPQRGDCLFVLEPRAISREAQLDRVQQVLIAEGLGQELDRSSLYRLDGHRDVAVSGDEDDRNVNVCRQELSLKIKTTSTRQPDIEHKASGAFRA